MTAVGLRFSTFLGRNEKKTQVAAFFFRRQACLSDILRAVRCRCSILTRSVNVVAGAHRSRKQDMPERKTYFIIAKELAMRKVVTVLFDVTWHSTCLTKPDGL